MWPGSTRAIRLLAAAAVVLSCADPPRSPRTVELPPERKKLTADTPPACKASLPMRFRAAALSRDEGKLDRALRLFQEADRLCVATGPATWSAQMEVLMDLGRFTEALAIAAQVESARDVSPQARAAAVKVRLEAVDRARPPPSREAAQREGARLFQEGVDHEKTDAKVARERFLAAWKASRPNGEALLRAGLLAKAAGEAAAARRLLDRALHELEASIGKPALADVPNGFDVGNVIAWSADGESVALGNGPRLVVLGGPSLEEKKRLGGHVERATSVAFSPDGKWIASGSADPALRIWDAATGAIVREFAELRNEVLAVTFSPDGRLLVAASDDGWVQAWDTATWQVRFRFDEGRALLAMAMSPRGDRLATGGADGRVRLYALPKGDVSATLEGHKSGVFSLSFSADGKRLATGSMDRTARLWDVATKRTVRAFKGYSSGLALSPDARLLAFAADTRALTLYDAQIGIVRGTLRGHTGQVLAAAFSPDGKRLLSSADDRTAILWDVALSRSLLALEGHGKPLAAVAFSPKGNRIAAVSRDRRVLLFGGGPRGLLQRELKADVTGTLAFSPDGKLLATATAERSVEVWEAETGAGARSLATLDGAITQIAFHPQGKLLATSSADKTVVLHDVATGQLAAKLEKHKGAVHSVAFSPDGRLFATGGADFQGRFWDTAKREATAVLEHGYQNEVTSVVFSPDGQKLATASRGDTLWMWNASNAKVLFSVGSPAGSVRTLAFSRDGQLLASAGRDGGARVFRSASGKFVRRLEGSRAAVEGVAFSPSRDLLASASADGSIFLFEPEAGVPVATVRAVAGAAGGYVVSADGRIEMMGEPVADVVPVCRIGGRTYPFALCEERATTPGLFAKILAGDKSYRDP